MARPAVFHIPTFQPDIENYDLVNQNLDIAISPVKAFPWYHQNSSEPSFIGIDCSCDVMPFDSVLNTQQNQHMKYVHRKNKNNWLAMGLGTYHID